MFPAHDYHPDVGLMVVAGEFCGAGSIWCNVATKKTLLSSDGGLTFSELADFPADGAELTCGLFLDEATFMVIGGRKIDNSAVMADTWLYDVAGDTWSSGAAMTQARGGHSCTLVTDCDGNGQVVVVGGTDGTAAMNNTEIYDVDSGSWSAGTG